MSDQLAQRLDLVTAEAGRHLDGWDEADRRLFQELMEDGGSELQRELLQRAVAMGHSPTELHAFADHIRGLSDGQLNDLATPAVQKGVPLDSALRAFADPLLAWQSHKRPLAKPVPPELGEEPKTPPEAMRTDAEARPAPPDEDELHGGDRTGFADDLFNDAIRSFGFQLDEHAIDDARVTVDKVVPLIAEALARAIPVPVVVGPSAREHRRYALFLQVQSQSGTRSFQLHDPFAQETVWVREADILGLKELTFSDKQHRRLTAVALPRALGSALA
jgi:hypothetical protein